MLVSRYHSSNGVVPGCVCAGCGFANGLHRSLRAVATASHLVPGHFPGEWIFHREGAPGILYLDQEREIVEEWEARRLEATVQTAALCAYVDGHLATEERERMCECIATHAGSEQEARRLLALARELPEWIDTPEPGFRAAQFAEIKESLPTAREREHAFYLAVRVADAHGGIGMTETSFLLSLMAELEIDSGYARGVLERVRAERSLEQS